MPHCRLECTHILNKQNKGLNGNYSNTAIPIKHQQSKRTHHNI